MGTWQPILIGKLLLMRERVKLVGRKVRRSKLASAVSFIVPTGRNSNTSDKRPTCFHRARL